MYAHIQSLDQKFFQDNQTGDLMARVSNDVTTVREFLGPGLMDLFRSILLFVAGLAIMLTIDVKLALLAALPLPLITLLFVWVGGVIEQALPRRADAVRRPRDVRAGELLRRARHQGVRAGGERGRTPSSASADAFEQANVDVGAPERWRSGRCSRCSSALSTRDRASTSARWK